MPDSTLAKPLLFPKIKNKLVNAGVSSQSSLCSR